MTARFSVIVPTLNAGAGWIAWLAALQEQHAIPEMVVVMDSESVDGTPIAAAAAGFEVVRVARPSFDHGGTRQEGQKYVPETSEILVYLTQDAILAGPDALEQIVSVFVEPNVGMAYGRQLPRPDAGAIEAHARIFNYPEVNQIRDYEDKESLGLKAAFCSNSFAAYRRVALNEVGGFPTGTIFAEDMVCAAKMLKAGWRVCYTASATVYHSHDYSLAEEFRRYFDMGVLHARSSWLVNDFGTAEGQGKKFVASELRYLTRHKPQKIPRAVAGTMVKYIGYLLGKNEKFLPNDIKPRLSMNKPFWQRERT